MKDPVRAYLHRYAEPEAYPCAQAMAAFGHFGQCVVIPAMGEGPMLLRALDSVREHATLVILVANSRQDAEAWVHQRNLVLPERLTQAFGPPTWMQTQDASALPRMGLYSMPTGALLLVHRGERGHYLPARQGVGLARKIGTDIALALHASGQVASPWLGCTDADVLLPPDYFAQMRELPKGAAAATFAFSHGPEDDPERDHAIAHYEASLRYYVQGLRWAGSPYAFHTVGSTLAIHAAAYARVRGFPKLMAAEDFYLLDKLRKVGPVIALDGHPLTLSGRVSPRVPFGTGRAMMRAQETDVAPCVYHPHVFLYLRAYLDLLAAAVTHPRPAAPALPVPLQQAVLTQSVEHLGTWEAVDAAHKNTRSEAPRRRFLHTWFDAFRTLKLVHYLREHALPSLPLCEAASEVPFSMAATTERAVFRELARRDQGAYHSTHAEAFSHF